MNSLIGTYECKADTKGRVMLPSALKKQLAVVMQSGFVLKRYTYESKLTFNNIYFQRGMLRLAGRPEITGIGIYL